MPKSTLMPTADMAVALRAIESTPFYTEYGGIRAGPEAAGKPIGGNDLPIAAHACAIGAAVVTANVDAFKRVRGLKVENWLA